MNSRLDVARHVLESPANGFPAEELFAAARTAVLIAAEVSGRVVEVNPAAERLLGIPRSGLIGCDWRNAFSESCAQRLGTAAWQAASSGTEAQAAASGSTDGAAMTATISTVCVSEVSYLLVRLVRDDASEAPSGKLFGKVFDELDAINIGFVVTDSEFYVEFANRAFREIVNQSCDADIEGQNLLCWLNLAQADLAALRRQMTLRKAGTMMMTTLCVGDKPGTTAEITAVAAPDADRAHWGFIVRKVAPH